MQSQPPSSPVPCSPSPPLGRVAGIDFGTVRIGVAISDFERKIASPWENYARRGLRQDAQFFRDFAAEERITLFVVGLPLHMSGDESEKSGQARAFGAWLADETGVPVRFFDERYSSRMADELLAPLTAKKRKERRDKLAAYVILASWLEIGGEDRES